MPNVIFKPRPRFLGYTYSKEPLRWQAFGFISNYEYQEWVEYNKLDNENYSLDLIAYFSMGAGDE